MGTHILKCTDQFTQSGIYNPVYTIITSESGSYFPVMVTDVNNCISLLEDTASVNTFNLPESVVTPEEITIYEGDIISLTVGEYSCMSGIILKILYCLFCLNWMFQNQTYFVFVTDSNNCTDTSKMNCLHGSPYRIIYLILLLLMEMTIMNYLKFMDKYSIICMIATNRWEIDYQTVDIQNFGMASLKTD